MKRPLPIRRVVDALTKAAGFDVRGRPLTARAVADLCGVELKTVHNWVLEGRLEHFRTPGRHLRFQRAAVHEFLLSCGYEAPSHVNSLSSVVAVRGGASAALRTALRLHDVTEVDDLPSGLITAARIEPQILVVDLTPRRPPPEAVTLQALARLLPRTRVVLFGKPMVRRARALHGAHAVDGVANLVRLLQELTFR